MLDPWIIEKIRRREETQREREAIQIEIERPPEYRREGTKPSHADDAGPQRGVTVIEF